MNRQFSFAAAALLAFALDAAPAAAANIENCYGRAYDRAHLAAKPRQRVTEITLSPSAAPTGAGAGTFAMQVDVKLRGQLGASDRTAVCKATSSSTWSCNMEGDAGRITLAGRPSAMMLTVQDGFRFETSKAVIDLAESDDRVFNLALIGCH